MTSQEIGEFQSHVYTHYQVDRLPMPWRDTPHPYKVLVSEFMLQQTQVSRVCELFPPFLRRFPNLKTLASASRAEVLTAWQGLGYNRRAIYLHRSVQQIMEWGSIPPDEEKLLSLPGIGKYTASAIRAFAFNLPAAVIDTNIRRVYIHCFFADYGEKVSDAQLEGIVEETMDRGNVRVWYYALMDWGSILVTALGDNPNKRSTVYRPAPPFEGSNRQLRGRILRMVIEQRQVSISHLVKTLADDRIEHTLSVMQKEGLILSENQVVYLPE